MSRLHGRSGWTLGFVAGCALLAASASADELQLRNGGRVSGRIVQRTARAVTIETSPGLLTLPMSRIEKIVEGRSALEIWHERSAALSPRDAEGWTALARWAEGQGLETQARSAWEHVIAVNPRSAEANAALGRVQLNGAWVSREEGYRAQGLVPFEGRWVPRAEYEALLQQRAAENAADLSRREAELRLREADAHAREAEARARGAEAAAMPAPGSGYDGMPLGYGVPYGAYGYDPYGSPFGHDGGFRHGGHFADNQIDPVTGVPFRDNGLVIKPPTTARVQSLGPFKPLVPARRLPVPAGATGPAAAAPAAGAQSSSSSSSSARSSSAH